MGLVTKLHRRKLETASKHLSVDCTYDVVTDDGGKKYLQLDTYGSIGRKVPGKKSQSLRLAPAAIEQLKKIIADHQL